MGKPKACSPNHPTRQAWVGGAHWHLLTSIKGLVHNPAPGSTDPLPQLPVPTWGRFSGKASWAQFFPPRCFPGNHPRGATVLFPCRVGEVEIPCSSVVYHGGAVGAHAQKGMVTCSAFPEFHVRGGWGQRLWGCGWRENKRLRADEIVRTFACGPSELKKNASKAREVSLWPPVRLDRFLSSSCVHTDACTGNGF